MELKISEKNSLDCKDEDNSINKHIHQIWIGEKPVPYIYINSWKDDYISKNKDWQYTLWNEKEINSLFLNNIEDALVFRVQANKKITQRGMISLCQKAIILKLDASNNE